MFVSLISSALSMFVNFFREEHHRLMAAIVRRSNNNNERDPWSDLKLTLFLINLNPAALSGTNARKIYEGPLIVKISV